jgi:tritrans,polycis-undecaprenyl-diphosphate synthase [geranylgeranyl-diphosphate specific]
MLPEDLQEKIDKVRNITKDYSDWSMNLAIAYGGRQEIVNAVRNIASEVSAGKLSPDKIDEAVIQHNLSTNDSPDPDLIIRTGGEKRISNFLTFQSTYSEFMFLDTLWPELGKEEFMAAVNDFSERDRRFGK